MGIDLVEQNNMFPKVIEIQTSSRCNARCSICPHCLIYPKVHRHDKLDTETVYKIIDEIASHKNMIDRVIPYWNNEPFLDDRILDFLYYINEKDLEVELSTNASVLKKNVIDAIFNNELVKDFRISFFSSFPDSYHKIMPGLNYDKVVSNIEYILRKAKSSHVKVTINQVGYKGFDYDSEKKRTIELFGDDFRYHVFGYLDRVGSNLQKNELIATSQKSINLKGCSLRRAEEWMSITSNGDVVLCSQDWTKEIKFGNIYSESLSDIFTGELRLSFLERLYNDDSNDSDFICSRCKLSNVSVGESILSNGI